MNSIIKYKGQEYLLIPDNGALRGFELRTGIKLSKFHEAFKEENISLDNLFVLFQESIKRGLRHERKQCTLTEDDFEDMWVENAETFKNNKDLIPEVPEDQKIKKKKEVKNLPMNHS